MRISVPLAAASLLAAVLVTPPASAAPTAEAEPNNNLFQMNGPIGVEGAVGTLGTSDDVDLFRVGLRPQRQVRLRFQTTNQSSCGLGTFGARVYYSLTTEDGTYLASGAMQFDDEYTEDTFITTPGTYGGPTERAVLRFSADRQETVGCSYAFSVASSTGGATDAIDPSPMNSYPVVAIPEPNDLESQSYGSLSGDTYYQGAIETDNDVDRVHFQLKAGAAANVQLSVASGDVSVSSSTSGMGALSASGGQYSTASTDVSTSDRVVLLTVSGDTGSSYRLLVTPATSLGTTAPAPTQPTTKKLRVSLKASTSIVRRNGFVTLKGKVVGRSRGKVVIWQRTLKPGKGWSVEAKKKIRSNGRFKHREDVRGGTRLYKACYRKTCSKPVKVRMR